ncbi:MAG: Protein translocase subunit SecD [Cyanobacteria bacterium RYN_339]|nr:Protein translocase subunit SecD [Cyanobacteria bacterium RYN_339]
MDWRKLMLGLILVLAVGSGYIVLNNGTKWPFEFKRGLDIQGGMHLVLQAKPTDKVKEITPGVMSAAIAVVRNRVDGLGVSEPLIQPKGDDQLIVDMPGIKDKDEALRIIGTTAVLTFRAHKADFPGGVPAPAATSSPAVIEPAASKAATTPGATGAATTTAAASGAATATVTSPSPMAGGPTRDQAKDAEANSNDWVLTGVEGVMITATRVEPQGSNWAVVADFNSEGSKVLADVSHKLLNKHMAIFLDNKLISDPVVQSELNTGNVMIHGDFDAKKANELMIVLKAGSLPVPLEVIENRSVEASLGAESVRATFLAGIIGAALIMIFMVGYYQIPGAVACAALVIYSLVTLAIFKMIPVTLTVPGIAGFILSMGMAVDANILIFERTKEELKGGRTIYAAIEIGFKRAFSAIFDSNVSSMLTCTVLFYFGTGLVKGFALTLAIGVIISMFTAISATRNLLHWVLEAKQFKSPTLFGVKVPSKIR